MESNNAENSGIEKKFHGNNILNKNQLKISDKKFFYQLRKN